MSRATTPLASYLFTRLKQLHVHHAYGVPGDFTLKALDHLKSSGIRFVGCCNELNAGYAADGYARVRRHHGVNNDRRTLGALFTTYGVGELSAANAVAGSFAEHVPLVHIVGSPSRKALAASSPNNKHLQIHHALGNGNTDVFRDIAKQFTVAQLNLADTHTEDVPDQIDWVLGEAMNQSRPVYVELPTDRVGTQVDSGSLSKALPEKSKESPNNTAVTSAANSILEKLGRAKQSLILVDRGDGVDDIRDEINKFVEKSKIPTLALPSGMSVVDNSLENYYGVHSGPVGGFNSMPFSESTDFVIAFGPMFSDTQTLGWSTVPARQNMVIVGRDSVDDVPVDSKEVLNTLIQLIDDAQLAKPRNLDLLGNFRNIHTQNSPREEEAITQEWFYTLLSPRLREGDTVFLGNATPIIGGRDMVVPPNGQVIASGLWFSIGHMLPAVLGASQAREIDNKPGRTILLDGDGSFQVTAQELSTIIHERADAIIFIMNNNGYTYERYIHGMDEEYNNIADWDYLQLPRLFTSGSQDYPIETHRVRNWGELDGVLKSKGFQSGKGLTLVDVVVDKYDIPEHVKAVFERAGDNL